MNQTAMAAVNLKAVLRTLEKLPELDPKSKQLLEHVPLTLQFKAANVGSGRLHRDYRPFILLLAADPAAAAGPRVRQD